MSEALSRRQFLRRTAALALPSALGCAPSGSRRAPNILFLLADDQRFNTLRALGNEEIDTPNLDQLVRSGVSFSNAYIMGGNNVAVCMPSRAMLLTGRRLWGLQGAGESIPDTHIMFPELLRRYGYQCFGTGKWHNGTAAFNRCFDNGDNIMFGGMGDHWNVRVSHFDHSGHYDNLRPYIDNPFRGNAVGRAHFDVIHPGVHSSELFADTAISFLRGHKRRAPFCAYVSFMAPHDPRTTPKAYLDRYDAKALTLPKNFLPQHQFDNGEMSVRDELLEALPRDPQKIKRHLAEYYAMITHLDAQIGRILQALAESGNADNTLIVFTGDNGLAVGQHGLMGKQSVYEHSVRVPLIISGPGIPQNERREAFCYLLDIYPTLCDLLGIARPESVQGVSMMPVFADALSIPRAAVYFAYRNLMRGIRAGDWKLILTAHRSMKHTQLFNLNEDPWETRNLAEDAQYEVLVQDLTAQLRRLMREAKDPVELNDIEWETSKMQHTF